MTKEDWLIEEFGDRVICLRGVGKMFYQHGFPIPMSIFALQKLGIEVSILHIADECMKKPCNWSPSTTYKKLKEELVGEKTDITKEQLKNFCFAGYEDQREMIFKYLYATEDAAISWLESRFDVIAKEQLLDQLEKHFQKLGIKYERDFTINLEE